MKPDPKTRTKIKLSKTFFRIQAGEEKVGDAVARKQAEKEAARAEAAKKGKPLENTDPFMKNYCR